MQIDYNTESPAPIVVQEIRYALALSTATLYDAPQDATRIYTTNSTGLADNEDSYTSTPIAGKFTNDRVIGEIVLTKSDLDQAVEGADTALHGTSSIEGAVYDLYAAEDIQHPDGVSGVVD